MIPSTRAAAVAAAVPPLRFILLRALHTSSTSHVGSHVVQRRPSRPAVRPRLEFPNARPSPRPRFENKPTSGAYTAPSSSSRLAAFDSIANKHDPYDDTPPSRSTIGEEEEDVEAPDVPEDRYEREKDIGFVYHPRARPFKPNAYPTPESALGEDVAAPKAFGGYALHEGLEKSMISRFGEDGRTSFIQSLALHHFCSEEGGEPLIGSRTILGAETGSGKTFAYLLPMLHHLKLSETPSELDQADSSKENLLPRAIVLQPTHELTRQSTAMAKSLTHNAKLSVLGMSNSPDGGVRGRRGHVDVLFGTGAMTRRMMGIRKPGMEIEEGYKVNEWVGVDRVDWLVIDEADILLSKDFRAETLLLIKKITETRPNVNIILCTATFPPALLNLLTSHDDLQKHPFTHLLSPKLHKLPKNLEARFVPRSRGDLFSDVTHEVRRIQTEDAIKRNHMIAAGNSVEKSKIIIFVNQDSRARVLGRVLEEKGHENLVWTSTGIDRRPGSSGALKSFLLDPKVALASATPKEILEEVKSVSKVDKDVEEPRILITTGILSRGLDFSPSVSTVFLVDQPKDILDFMHRAGRAGRAGRKGRVVIFGWTQGRSAEDGQLGSVIRQMVHSDQKDVQALWVQKRQERLEMIRERQKELAEKQARREGVGIKKDDVTRGIDGREYKRPRVGWAKEAPGYGMVQGKLREERLVGRFGKEHVRGGRVVGLAKRVIPGQEQRAMRKMQRGRR